MRVVNGTFHNFPRSIGGVLFGRVTTIHSECESESILIETDSATLPHIVLSDRYNSIATSPFIHTDHYIDLKIGDILQIFPSGRCVVAYESASDDNALFLTDACNSRCLMCPQPPKKQPNSFANDSFRILDLIKGSPKALGITGGEPTVFWNDLIRLINKIRDKHSETFLQILTNARLLNDPQKAKRIVAAAGEKAIFCVPLYSDDERTHNHLVGRESFWQTMDGLYNLGMENANIEIRNVILKQNIGRLKEYGQFVYRNLPFAKHIALMGMEPIGLAYTNFDSLWLAPNDYMPLLEETVLRFHMQGMHASIFNHPHCVLPRNLWDFSAPSISDWKVRYYEVCKSCAAASKCGGVFFSARQVMAPFIEPIQEM